MKKSLLLLAAAALMPSLVQAQYLKDGYVYFPNSETLSEYITAWNAGTQMRVKVLNTATNTYEYKDFNDDEFFTSRVKPRPRFFSTATQINPNLTQWSKDNLSGNDKRICWWVPINSLEWNAIPDGRFDTEAFSMWSYIDTWGDWTSPHGWVPGALADIAHKNGVGVSGVASIPQIPGNQIWYNEVKAENNIVRANFAKFLYYHGVDGLGYNSEYSNTACAPRSYTTDLHQYLRDYFLTPDKDGNCIDPLWEVIWYGGTGDGGGCYFDSGLNNSTEIFKGASIFYNYNWVNNNSVVNAITTATNGVKDGTYKYDRGPMHLYAGCNMQGGEPHSLGGYPWIQSRQVSIGYWGAHSVNMFWQARALNGSADATKQRTYMNTCERFFSNAARNPAIAHTIYDTTNHAPTNDQWHGVSTYMSARSNLEFTIADEPFISYFNLGNGKFMNIEGERVHSNEWYNIGVQDYMPTWRWWFAPTLLQRSVTKGSVNLAANFVWTDAWFGGSCLNITGTSAKEYLHLFKTKIAIAANNKIVVRYKLLDGEADIRLVLTTYNTPGTESTNANFKSLTVLTADESESVADNCYNTGKWVTKVFTVPSGVASEFTKAGGLGLVALEFTNAKNLDFYLGEFGIYKGSTTVAAIDKITKLATPAAPVINKAKCQVLANLATGVDAKLYWSMENSITDRPCYNADVKTSMFRIYSQQQGGEQKLVGVTTSWAGFAFSCPNDASLAQKMRFGVSAMAIDGLSESSIAWTDYITLPNYQVNETVEVNKPVIKPNESFTIGYVDPAHAAATSWVIKDAETNSVYGTTEGTVRFTGSGRVTEVSGLPYVGAYNVEATCNGVTTTYPRMVIISGTEVGALPQIYSLKHEDKTVDVNSAAVSIDVNDGYELSYTGRASDGKASRGVSLDEGWFGVPISELGLAGHNTFAISAWVKYNDIPAGRSNFVTVEDRTGGGWPYAHWGYFWSRVTEEGKFTDGSIDTSWGMRVGGGTEGQRLFYKYADSKIDVNAWTHIAIVWDYQGNNVRQHFYVNGKKQTVTCYCSILKSVAEGYFASYTGSDWSRLELLETQHPAVFGTNTTDPQYASTSYPLTDGMWICFGGLAQNITAVNGCVDDFTIWNKVLTEDDVRASMTGLDPNNLPEGVIGFWTLEEDATTDTAGDKCFVGKTCASAANKAPKAYWYKIGTEGDTRDKRVKGNPEFLSGCPFIPGTAYEIVTKPSWTTQRGANIVGDGTGEEGTATFMGVKPNDYNVKLTLANGHGEDSQMYPVITVNDPFNAIDEVGIDEGAIKTFTVDKTLFVDFAVEGEYTIDVYTSAGMLVAQKNVKVVDGQNVSITLANAGVYLVKVSTRGGHDLRTFKVISK